MKLKKFIDHKKFNVQQLADGVGEPHETVRQHVLGNRYPRPKTAAKYITFSKGLVSLADIYGSPRQTGGAA